MKNVVIIGPGGIGGTIAGVLARRNTCDVTVAGRAGAHIDAIQRNGLHLTGLDEFTVPIKAVDDLKYIKACDLLIFAMKAQDMQTALSKSAHIDVRDAVISLQNGVMKDDLLADAFGREKVLGALSVIASGRPEPGVINWTFDGGTHFGELNGLPSKRVDEITALFQEAGLVTRSTDAILSYTWTKVVGWIPIGLLATLSRQNNAGVLSNRILATELVLMIRELKALADLKNIPMIDFGPYQMKTWCEGTVEEAVEHVMTSPLTKSTSTHSALQDIQKGRTTEFQACVAPLIEEARKQAVAIPRTQVMYAALMGLEATL
jgi:2-dehydropantoate 2-reductase